MKVYDLEQEKSDAKLAPSVASVWREFKEGNKTEADCLEQLYARLPAGTIRCQRCGNTDLPRPYGARMVRCEKCHKRTWLLAGTFFERIKEARHWLAAIYFLERGVAISSRQFEKLLGIAYATASDVFRKLAMVMGAMMQEGTTYIPTFYFEPAICKRSRETPARQHPFSEEEQFCSEAGEEQLEQEGESEPAQQGDCLTEPLIEQCEPAHERACATGSGENSPLPLLDERQARVYEALQNGSAYFDQLIQLTDFRSSELSACLTMLELDGLVTRQPGDRYALVSSEPDSSMTAARERMPLSQALSASLQSAISFVREVYHGVSRKYLQHYLAVQWYCKQQKRQQKGLLEACVHFGPIRWTQVSGYRSPRLVKIHAG